MILSKALPEEIGFYPVFKWCLVLNGDILLQKLILHKLSELILSAFPVHIMYNITKNTAQILQRII